MSLFDLKQRGTSVSRECSAGFITFLSMMYIIFVNPAVLSKTGMPFGGLFVATILITVICTLAMAFFANVPFAMAPGMGMNTFAVYVMCLSHGFHWKEALAVVFCAGVLHCVLMLSGLRKSLVRSIPRSLKYANAVAIGLFIAYVGVKNADLLMFFTTEGNYVITPIGTVIANSTTVPSLGMNLTHKHIVTLVGLFVTIFLMVREKKTGDSHAPLLIGILTAIFIGIPLNVTEVGDTQVHVGIAYLAQFRDAVNAFWGDPGLASLLHTPAKQLPAALMILALLLNSVVDSVCGIVGMGRVDYAAVFKSADREAFYKVSGISSNLDRSLIVASTGGITASFLGSSTAAAYVESVTGVVAGGRTGLTALVTALLFLACLPFSRYVGIIPAEAMAPALILVGLLMMTLVRHINWTRFEESAPAATVILLTPLTWSIVHGVIFGYAVHICIQLALGKGRSVHPLLYVMTGMLVLLFTLFSVMDF